MDETAAQDGGRAATPGAATGRDEEAPTAGRSAADDFFDAAIALLQQVRDGEGDAVREAGALLADTVAAGGRVFAFGAGHSSLPAQDTVYRAGGLAVMNLLNIPGAVGVDVRPATLERVRRAIGELGYRPDPVARRTPGRAGSPARGRAAGRSPRRCWRCSRARSRARAGRPSGSRTSAAAGRRCWCTPTTPGCGGSPSSTR